MGTRLMSSWSGRVPLQDYIFDTLDCLVELRWGRGIGTDKKRLTGEYKWLRERERGFYIELWYDSIKSDTSTILCETLLKIMEWNAIFFPLAVPGLCWGTWDPFVVVYEQHVGSSSLTRDRPGPPEMTAQSLSHWTPRKSRNADIYQLPDPQTWRF